MQRIYHWLAAIFKRKRRLTPEEIEKKLPSEALAALHREAEFLRGVHGVAVAELKEGEMPAAPKAIDPEIDRMLTPPAAPTEDLDTSAPSA